VLDGLLENDTILRPREHYTDTHGFTEQLFGLCFLLGYSFMARLRDLALTTELAASLEEWFTFFGKSRSITTLGKFGRARHHLSQRKTRSES
jgi:TnpA family transposase